MTEHQSRKFTRRAIVLGSTATALAGCATTAQSPEQTAILAEPAPVAPLMYAALPTEQFPVPAVDISQIDPRFWRQDIDYETDEKTGTLIVDTPNKYLYHVHSGGRATRYGIGVGREGFAWAGRAVVAYKRKWPRWTPPDSMVARQPELRPYSVANGGMDPGLRNPLGARALYIHENGVDTLYRLHGTPQANSIGKAVSSGCIRLLNQDVIHLYDTVTDGSSIVVIPDPSVTPLLVGSA
ncbi:L,D-transpeptidase (plasmid) [Sinorhizobium mexicanum]|uniref:L,D-transpeptidase n=1 Tax=Sinorhizobium mexicanum TaxID=375549 RepID=A0A859QU02_9HYPH|nr:L,D-transpeptidase [Sinorhizobium mexicanum]QLL63986.1 L,D-transpeptidase [Sinorhizobium mexicanum]